MDNEQITHELLLKFKGLRLGAKIPLTEQIRDIVGNRIYDVEDTIQYISDSGYFTLLTTNIATLTDKGFEYANRTHY